MSTAVSIVVACTGGDEMLSGCLESLEAQRGDAEVIAVGAWDAPSRGRLSQRFPWVTLLEAEEGTSVFVRRARGLARSRGQRLMLLEDHCRAAPGWLQALTTAGQTAAGGPVRGDSAPSWRAFALYLVEYSALMPPLADGPCPALLAVNAAYGREALFAVTDAWREAFYDNEVHDALRASGHPTHAVAAAVVDSRLDLALKAACAHLFAGGRRFGGRCDNRTLRFLAAPILPLVLLGRILSRVARRRPSWLARTLLAVPLMLLLLAAWSAGEALGALAHRRS